MNGTLAEAFEAQKGNPMRVETDRLIITEFTPDMARVLHENSLDEDNRRFVPDEVFETVEEARETIAFLMTKYGGTEGPLVCPVLTKADGENIGYQRFTYIMLHKPAGVLSAVEDKRQKTVLDLLPEELQRRGLSPVGRLDKDTEGLLLLTNDGELTHQLLSPRRHVDKVA